MNKELRVWWSNNHGQFLVPVKNVDEALVAIRALSIREQDDETIIWNAFGLEEKKDGEWTEWYERMGYDIREVRENREKENT